MCVCMMVAYCAHMHGGGRVCECSRLSACGGVVIIDSKRENYSSMLDFRLSLLIGKTLYI